MARKGYTEEQIGFALRQAESGTAVTEICRKMGVAQGTFYRFHENGLQMQADVAGSTLIARRCRRAFLPYGLSVGHFRPGASWSPSGVGAAIWKAKSLLQAVERSHPGTRLHL